MSDFEQYPCVGICVDDPASGCCLGCGRPPAPAVPRVVASKAPSETVTGAVLPDVTAEVIGGDRAPPID